MFLTIDGLTIEAQPEQSLLELVRQKLPSNTANPMTYPTDASCLATKTAMALKDCSWQVVVYPEPTEPMPPIESCLLAWPWVKP